MINTKKIVLSRLLTNYDTFLDVDHLLYFFLPSLPSLLISLFLFIKKEKYNQGKESTIRRNTKLKEGVREKRKKLFILFLRGTMTHFYIHNHYKPLIELCPIFFSFRSIILIGFSSPPTNKIS